MNIQLITILGVFGSISAANFDIGSPPVFLEHDLKDSNSECTDLDPRCVAWSTSGECTRNAAWMSLNCRRSCKSCQGGKRALKLRQHISDNYDNSSLANNYTTNIVHIVHTSIDHVEMDEPRQFVNIHGRMVLSWNDSRIAWSQKDWDIAWLNFYWLQIWTPDIVQQNLPNSQVKGRVTRKILAANYTGQVYLWLDFTFTVACALDYGGYPNDVQKCCAEIDDKRFFAVRFVATPEANHALTLSLSKTHLSGWSVKDADLKSNKFSVKLLEDWNEDPYGLETTNCELCVHLQRRANFYAAEIVAPAIATGVLTAVSFVAASGFDMQVLLLLASMALQILSSAVLALKLPNGAVGTPAIISYASVNMGATITCLIITLFLRRLSHHRSAIPVPHSIHLLIQFLQKCAPCLCDTDQKQAIADEQQEKINTDLDSGSQKRHWQPLAVILNRSLFVLMVLVYSVLLCACFLM